MSKYLLFTAVLSLPTLMLALRQQQTLPAQKPPAAQTSQSGHETGQNPTAISSAAPNQPTDQLDSKTRKTMDDAAKNGAPLVVSSSVADKADVEAVLLPYEVTKHVFGREVADNYAAVEITISNHSADQTLVVQSVFIDYSQWALGGSKFIEKMAPAETTKFQKANKSNQIASVEYRAVRGDALDAQPWTKRNITIRALRLAGSIASGFSFVTRDQDIVHGITAFAGQGVPAAETFWPDGTVEQMNRISDLGFKVNKVIPKSSSDILVAFFPLKRFLTKGLNEMFKKSPALFFAPYALAFDHKARNDLRPIFVDFVGKDKADKFMTALPLVYMCSYESIVDSERESGSQGKEKPFDQAQIDAMTAKCEDTIKGMTGLSDDEKKVVPIVMKFLAHASLNTVRVVVGGDFTLNVNEIPATVSGVDLDGGPAAWSTGGDKTGVLRGSFVATGTPQIVEADKLGISNLAAVDNTNDSTLKFKMTLKSPVPPGTTLTFRIDKTNNETKKTVKGVPFPFSVPTPPPSTSMDVSNALTKDNILSVFGQNFADTTDQPLKVLFFSDPAKTTPDATVAKADFKQQTTTQIDIDLCTVKGLSLDDSTWTVKVQEGSVNAAHSATFKAPASAKSKCPKTGGASPAAQPQGAAKAQGGGTTPPPGKTTARASANGKPQKKGGQ
jgi:hypothetical protein